MDDARRHEAAHTIIGTKSGLPPFKTNMHLLPCKIHYDGPAAVSTYFRVEDRSTLKSKEDEGSSSSSSSSSSFSSSSSTSSSSLPSGESTASGDTKYDAIDCNEPESDVSAGKDGPVAKRAKLVTSSDSDDAIINDDVEGDTSVFSKEVEKSNKNDGDEVDISAGGNNPDAPLRARFRGRLLEGRKVKLPEGCFGYNLEESTPPVDGDQSKRFLEVRSTFDSVTVWQHDRDPDDNDMMRRALRWIEISKALHDQTHEEPPDELPQIGKAKTSVSH